MAIESLVIIRNSKLLRSDKFLCVDRVMVKFRVTLPKKFSQLIEMNFTLIKVF